MVSEAIRSLGPGCAYLLKMARLGRVACLAMGLLVMERAFAVDPEPAPSPNADDITGVYDGYFSYRNRRFSLELTVTKEPSTKSLTAVFTFANEETPHDVQTYAMKGQYDSATYQFKLQPTRWISGRGAQVGLEGQLNPATRELETEIIGEKEAFALKPNLQKTAETQAKAAAERKKLEEGPTALADAKSDDERRGVLVRWFRELRKAFPEIDFHHTSVDQLSSQVILLFYDDKFVPVFGKPYDSLTIDERNNLRRLGRQLFGSPETRDLLEGFGDFVLSRPFELGTSTYAFGDFAPKVARKRGLIEAWREKIAKLNALPSSANGYDEFVAIRLEGDKRFADLPRPQLREFSEAIDAALNRIAGGALREKAHAAVVTADNDGNLLPMKKLFTDEGELFGRVAENVKAEVLERTDGALRSVIEKDELQNSVTGTGIVAVMSGNQWWNRLDGVYGFASARPPVQDATKRLTSRRSADLAQAAASIIAEISQQADPAQTEKIRLSYMVVPGDSDTDVAAKISGAVTARQTALKRELERDWLSPNERAWMTCDGKMTPPTPLPPPDEDDIRFAITRELASMGGKRTGVYAVRWGNENRSIHVSVERVDRDSVTKNEDGFKVHYYLEVDCNVRQSVTAILSTGTGADEIVDSITGGLDGEHDDNFVFGEHGWSSPTLHGRQISYLN
jgi:hypothetical protein